jgi:hypothetical protein
MDGVDSTHHRTTFTEDNPHDAYSTVTYQQVLPLEGTVLSVVPLEGSVLKREAAHHSLSAP